MQPKILQRDVKNLNFNSNFRQKVIIFILTVMLLTIALGPLYFTFITSLKPAKVTWGKGLGNLGISSPTLENYKKVLIYNEFWESYIGPNVIGPMINSLIVAIVVTCIALIIGGVAAYGLALLKVPGKNIISIFILFAYVFPPFVLIVPLSIFLGRLGLLDSLVGVGLSHLIIAVPFATWMMRGYFLGIAVELVEAAQVDGCSKLGALMKIILPISSPGIVTAAIFAFTRSWSEFLYALIILNSKGKYTLPIAATALKVSDVVRWGELMSVAIIAALPPVILYMIIQRYIVTGLTAGATKG